MELEVPLGAGRKASGCRACGRVFTSLAGFDKHQRLRNGGVVCLKPEDIGLHKDPNGRYRFPARDDFRG
jgi:hypothetical protein